MSLSELKQQEMAENEAIFKMNNITFYNSKFTLSERIADVVEQLQKDWRNKKMSNLKYLMMLNKYAGRSYLDPVYYPVMPWVIANYDFKQLTYRDLSQTLGSLGSPARKEHYLSKTENSDPFGDAPPYQYGTHYSSPGMVFGFLVRLSPYSEAAKTLQGGRFDLSDRLFSSMKVCWHSVTH